MRTICWVFLGLSAGCAFHPAGEEEERERARKVLDEPPPPVLSAEASLEDLLRYAYLSSAELRRSYWEWRAALERIPQAGSPATTLAVSFGTMFEGTSTSWKTTTLAVGNDPMANIPWPGKLKTAARQALEYARAAGLRFDNAKLGLLARVKSAYYDYAFLGESIRLQESNVLLLEVIRDVAEARTTAGRAPQQDLLKARNALDLGRNELATLKSRSPGRLASLNALLNLAPDSPLNIPKELPVPRELKLTDAELLERVAVRNPELAALAREVQGRKEGVRLMRQEWIPSFGLSVSGDLGGMARSLMAMVTAPLLRYEAIRAGIAEAKAELEAARAMRRQMEHDLSAKVILNLYDLRNTERQTTLYRDTLLPRAEQMVETSRAAYVAGQVPLVELMDSQRMLLELRLMQAELRTEREKLLAELESLAELRH